MKIIAGTRRSGKTTKLIQHVLKDKSIGLVVATRLCRDSLMKKYKPLENRVFTFDDLFNGRLRGNSSIKKLAIDDFDMILPKLAHNNLNTSKPIDVVALTVDTILFDSDNLLAKEVLI